jgi:hypothetical protein
MRLRGYQHQRLDGSTPAQLRHQAMEHFNAPGWCFGCCMCMCVCVHNVWGGGRWRGSHTVS